MRPQRRTAVHAESSVFASLVIFLLGFTIPFPGLVIPGALLTPRYVDVLILVATPLAWYLHSRNTETRPAYRTAALWLSLVLIGMIGEWLTFGELWTIGDMVLYGRWIITVILASALVPVLGQDRTLQRALLLGIVVGSTTHIVTIIIADFGGISFLQAVGFSSRRVLESSAVGQSRITSLAEHPNAAMILIGLAVPAAFAYRLLSRPDEGKTLLLVSLLVVAVGFYYTLSRSSTIAAFAAFLVAQLQMAKRRDTVARFFPTAFGLLALAAIAIGIYYSGVSIVDDRLADRVSTDASDNLQGRVDTVIATFFFIFSNPFGVGWTNYLELGDIADGLRASHNGYLFTGRTLGIALAAIIFVGHIKLLLAIYRTRRVDAVAPLAIYWIIVMFAEDVTQGSSGIFVTTLLAMIGLHGKVWTSLTYRSALIPVRSKAREDISSHDDRP